MILVFGGTTEGRMAVAELEESGHTFYYSTLDKQQDISLHHGIRLCGAMPYDAMVHFIQEKEIRMILDAAHPFATHLHQTIADVSSKLNIPVLRFDRIYPVHDKDIIYCEDYNDAVVKIRQHGIKRLLATTGVKSISKLKILETFGIECFYRILQRQSSVDSALQQGVAFQQLCYYEGKDKENKLFIQLHPDGVIMKESGVSGGYLEKIAVARRLGIAIFVIKRPVVSPHFIRVNGQHGMRLMIERILPDFYPLHSGITTGTCATAAAIAAAVATLKHRYPSVVAVVLPNGESIQIKVFYRDNYAYVVKDSGDDPDVTNGIEIRAVVHPLEDHRIVITGGEGVGKITLPGFDFPPGDYAINKVPRQMITDNLRMLTSEGLHVTISVPNGKAIASRTFNPRLGIVGGISIVGVSGIIKPFSEAGFLNSIRKCMEVAKATGSELVVINSGAKSERYVKAQYPELPAQVFVEYGNFIGKTIMLASELCFKDVVLGVMLGKAVKLAAGNLDTHSKKTVMNKDFIVSMLIEADCQKETIDKAREITLARELWTIIPEEMINSFCRVVIGHCLQHCQGLLPNGRLTVLLIDEQGNIHQ